MFAEERISLDCPCCGEAIYEPLDWFKKTYSTCPACEAGLAAGQFAQAVEDIEREFDAHLEEMLKEPPSSGGCCGGHKH